MGVTSEIKQLARMTGVNLPAVRERIRRGYDPVDAAIQPLRKPSQERAITADDVWHMQWMHQEGVTIQEIAEDYQADEQYVRKVVQA